MQRKFKTVPKVTIPLWSQTHLKKLLEDMA